MPTRQPSSSVSLALAVIALVTLATTTTQALDVHMVSHTHDDVGWLKTVDQYFYGANNTIQHAGVQYILDSVIQALVKDSSRRFIYVEIAFFERWWVQQDADTQATVRKLVANGQLEFINGGWCMNDEAATYWVDIVDQMARGHQFLMRTFGVAPNIGWHIDPFGHSAEQATLFAEMSFDGFMFGRIDYDDKRHRLADKTMEMVWRGSPSLGASQEIWTGVTYNGYGPPSGYCFDQFCDDPPIMDDERLFDYNVKERADGFVQAVRDQAKHFVHDSVLLTMGSDFEYENANEWFKNLDKLMNYINSHPDDYPDINVFYSTPSEYVKSVNAANLTWTVKTDDFFPYADNPHAFWTGYFTSRPALKGYVRRMSNYLQTARQLESLLGGLSSYNTNYLEHAMGVAQHHDAVSGTEKQHVAFDYAKRLGVGQLQCSGLINTAIAKLTSKGSSVDTRFEQCFLRNETVCEATRKAVAGDVFAVVVYNPLARQRTASIRIPVPTGFAWTVSDSTTGSKMAAGVEPELAPLPGRPTALNATLVFQGKLPALGYNTFFIEAGAATPAPAPAQPAAAGKIENSMMSVAWTSEGNLESITNKVTGRSLDLSLELLWYNSSVGNSVSGQESGAYIFRPNTSTPFPIASSAEVSTFESDAVSVAHFKYAPWASHTVRLYADKPYAEIEFQIGPIPFKQPTPWGHEVIARWTTPLATKGMYYTDANGRSMRPRKRNYRATWPYNNTEPISGNYYPVNSAAYIEDASTKDRFSVVTDRSCAGASIVDGQLEFMIHRRTLRDDQRGVGEPLNETGITGEGLIIRTSHLVFLEPAGDDANDLLRDLIEETAASPTVMFASTSSASAYTANHTLSLSAVQHSLPENVQLLTLKLYPTPGVNLTTIYAPELPNGAGNLDAKQALIRLAHKYAVGESAKYSKPVTVDLSTLFDAQFLSITSATEMNLSANQKLVDVHRLKWRTDSADDSTLTAPTSNALDHTPNTGRGSLSITLNPMQIRTFIVDLA